MSKAQRKRPRRPKDLLNTDTLEYYQRVADTFKEGFQNSEERELFLNNVFTQLEEEALSVCQSSAASPIIESLVATATSDHLRTLLTVFSKDWPLVCKDKNASHVLQGVIMVLPKAARAKLPSVTEEVLEASDDVEIFLIKTLINLCDIMLESIEEFVSNTYTSHVLRAVIQVLGGTFVGDTVMRSRATRDRDKKGDGAKKDLNFENYDIPKVFKKKLKHLCKSIFKLESFNMLLTDPNANPVIQTLLIVLKKVDIDRCQKYLLKVIKRSRITETENAMENTEVVKLPPVVQDSVGSYLVEQLIVLSSTDVYTELYTSLFKGRLLQFGLHSAANFVLQKLIRGCPDKDIFSEIFDELGQYVEDFLAINHVGVVVALAEACQKLGQKQQELVEILMAAFHCNEPVERQIKVVPLVASFKAYEMLYQSEEVDASVDKMESPQLTHINYHGSLILQQLLRFSNPKVVTASMLELRPLELKTLSCDACGSHVIDAFFQSETMTEKVKESLLNRIKVFLVDLACDKFGSRVIDSLWKYSSIKQKAVIASELSSQEGKVRSNKFGGFLYHKCALKLFAHRKNDWLGVQDADGKKRKMFEDIFETGKGGKKAKGKKRKKKGGQKSDKVDTV